MDETVLVPTGLVIVRHIKTWSYVVGRERTEIKNVRPIIKVRHRIVRVLCTVTTKGVGEAVNKKMGSFPFITGTTNSSEFLCSQNEFL